MTSKPAICDRMAVLADPTRGRLLLVLDKGELTVSELCAVLEMPQSTVSRHLKVLLDDGWLGTRRDGTHRYYRFDGDDLDSLARGLWQLTRGQVAATAVATQDIERLQTIRAQRRSRSREFFSSEVGDWELLRRDVFGDETGLLALLGLLGDDWAVGDLGCGTGPVTAVLAPFVGRVIAVDESPVMLEAARERVGHLPNVEVRAGELEALPVADGELDVAVLMLVLHHVAQPELVLAEAARALAPGGRLLIIDMLPHDNVEYREKMGHVWLGFGAEQLAGWMDAAGFKSTRHRMLPAVGNSKRPSLFVASARSIIETRAEPRRMVAL